MTHVHFDVETIIRDMRAQFTGIVIPKSAPTEHHALCRHREVTILLAKMFLEETNRGNDIDFVVWMMASFAAEFLENMTNFTELELEHLGSLFITHLMNCLGQNKDGTAEIAASVQVNSSIGGHA